MRWLTGLVGAVLVSGTAAGTIPGAAAATLGGAVVVRAAFSAAMPDRFGADTDGDGLIDLPNSRAYALAGVAEGCTAACEARFTLQLDATASSATAGGRALPIVAYRWEITGPWGERRVRSGQSPYVELALTEGRYRVALEVMAELPWGSARAQTRRTVEVEDFLVVALGDSYAAGEGNPERPRTAEAPAQWAAAPGDATATAAHAAAHRSTVAWPALAAVSLERASRSSSVTFLSLAASGARVDAGLLGPQPGVSEEGQITALRRLVGERKIDLLLLSVGGNDIGFSRVVRGLVDADRLADPVCYQTDLANVWASARDGDWTRTTELRWGAPWGLACRRAEGPEAARLPGLDGLPAALDRLGAAVSAGFEIGRVFLLGYPDPSGGDGEQACGEIVGDVTPPFRFHEIDRDEQKSARREVLGPLNEALRAAAARHGWSFLDGAVEEFAAGHGYCGMPPAYPAAAGGGAGPAGLAAASWYRHPARADLADEIERAGVSWYRTARQSVLLQGPGDAWATTGTLHPNELGHLALSRHLLEALAGD